MVLKISTENIGETDQDRSTFSGTISGDRTFFQLSGFRERFSMPGRIKNEPDQEVRGLVISPA
jgi:hypothetical protein